MKVKVQLVNGVDRWQLDARPIVENIDGYCQKVGLGSVNTKYCDTRAEGDPQREACDALVVGRARDTNRYGPTWYYNDVNCSATSIEGCRNHADNQFLVVARGPGRYLACASDDVTCGGCELRLGDEFCR
jgi:hypothetical protein